jgi:hypothetical protein
MFMYIYQYMIKSFGASSPVFSRFVGKRRRILLQYFSSVFLLLMVILWCI